MVPGITISLKTRSIFVPTSTGSNAASADSRYGADETVYLVVDSFGAGGSVYRETEIERTDLETVISDLITGQFSSPVRVVAFNTLEHWAKDVSADIAEEIRTRCDIEGVEVPEHIRDFVESQTERTKQLSLRLA
jgi:hypothetical protein